jgi:Leucine-rich repeat (LRR) protein
MKTSIYFIFLYFVVLIGVHAQGKLLDSAALENEPLFLTIEDAMKNPKKVYKLNLSRRQLTKIPQEVFQLRNLQELNISYNQIAELPKEIGLLTNLQRLDISVNQISELPATISLLKNLNELLLDKNRLTALPESIKDLKKLTWLELAENPIPKKEWKKYQRMLPLCDVVFE